MAGDEAAVYEDSGGSQKEAYLQAFGRLTLNYSAVEMRLAMIVTALLSEDQRVGLAMTTGRRASHLADDLKRISHAWFGTTRW